MQLSRLNLKLLRDLRATRSQALGLLVAIVLGVGLFQTTYLTVQNLDVTYVLCYDTLHFADFTVAVNPTSNDLVYKIRAIPGVREVTGRIVADAKIEQPHAEIPSVLGRLISLPTDQRTAINDVKVTSGQYFTGSGRREVLLEGNFARFHDYQPGDTIYVTIRDRRIAFRVAGIVASPEYLYPIASKEYLYPTPDTFGVVFLPTTQAERLLDMAGMISEVCVLTEPGQRERVMAVVQSMLARYGSQEPVPREEQPSNKLLMLDKEGMRGMGVLFPIFFLTAAALSVYSVLSRLVRLQRAQIGFLRASGLSRAAVVTHYCLYALTLGVLGGLIGTALGQWGSRPFTVWYLSFLEVPFEAHASGWGMALVGMTIAVCTCVGAALLPALGAARLAPAEAMRAASPPGGMRLTVMLARRMARLSLLWKLALRNLLRQGYRLVFTIIGIALGVALVVVSVASLDMSKYTMDYYFEAVRHYEAGISFATPQSDVVVDQIRAWPGVTWAEGTFGIPVTLTHGSNVLDTALSGISPHSRVFQFQDQAGRVIRVSQPGIYPTRTAAKDLGITVGDTVRVDYAFNARDLSITVRAPVVAIVEQPIGLGIYAPRSYLYQVFGPRLHIAPGTISAALVQVRPEAEQALKRRAFDMPQTAAVELIPDMRRQLDEQMASANYFIGVMVLFGLALMLAVVYNTVSINLFERRRELAALRALGLTLREMKIIVTLENLLAAALGLVVGLPVGWVWTRLVANAYQTEQYTILLHVEWTTYLIAILTVLAAMALSQWPALRSLARMDLAEAVKTMES